MLTVAIATEYDGYDAEIYRVLLERLLGEPVAKWRTDMRFNGDRSVRKLVRRYLEVASEHAVSHALLAIDNDGGAKRRPEHEDGHDQAAQAVDEKNGCRVCWLSAALPGEWTANGRKRCVVVPVQCIETWLVCLRGGSITKDAVPERIERGFLKKSFFGKNPMPVADRLRLALSELAKPDALDILRRRRSFQHFEAQLREWP